MDVSAYLSLLSLSEILDTIKWHNRYQQIRLDEEKIDRFQGIVDSLQLLLDNHSGEEISLEVEALLQKIYQFPKEAERIINTYITNQLLGVEISSGLSSFHQDIVPVIEKMELIKRELESMINIELPTFAPSQKPLLSSQHSVFSSQDRQTNPVVFEQLFPRIHEELTNHVSSLQLISIAGMGGIGKTTLARYIYNHHSIIGRFDERYWVTISQNYDPASVLKVILCIESTEDIHIGDLGHKLYQRLKGRRYLIVLDDIWSKEAWDHFENYFPDDGQGSRIILTTRDLSIGKSLCSSRTHSMGFLNTEKSWKLLSEKVFGENSCPAKFEEVGKVIAEYCGGLPLSIVTIAGVLSKSVMTLDYWNYVADNVRSMVSSDDNARCSKILSFSYNNLPMYLKPCFLYFGHYAEDEEIMVPYMIEKWVDKGIVKTKPHKTMEEAARDYLKELVDRNLIFVREWDDVEPEEIFQCGIHDLLLNICSAKIRNVEPLRDDDLISSFNLKICRHCGKKSLTKYFPCPTDRSMPSQVRILKVEDIENCSICCDQDGISSADRTSQEIVQNEDDSLKNLCFHGLQDVIPIKEDLNASYIWHFDTISR